MIEFLIAFALGAAGVWGARKIRMLIAHDLKVTVNIDRAQSKAADIARYFAEIAARMDERPEKMRVKFNAPSGVFLDMSREGDLIINARSERKHKLNLRRRWIADHPLPLALKNLVLYLEPVEANRFRAKTELVFTPPIITGPALSLLAAGAIILALPELVGLAIGIGLGLFIRVR